jgi:hypothetical protein
VKNTNLVDFGLFFGLLVTLCYVIVLPLMHISEQEKIFLKVLCYVITQSVSHNCHNPTNNPKQNKQLGWWGIIISNKSTPQPHFKATYGADFWHAALF